MKISSLRIIHQLKGAEGGDLTAPVVDPGAWLTLHTCQRHLWVGDSGALQDIQPERLEPFEIYSGGEAYHFLLRVATGLESAVKGETEVFGQIRAAWQEHQSRFPEEARRIAWSMQRLFEDTKSVRTEHLQGFGGCGYGSLVRKLLKGRPGGTILLVGAGQLAQAVLPYLDPFDVVICNRTRKHAEELAASLPPGARPPRLAEPGEELELWAACAHALVCAPLDDERDSLRVAAWLSRADRPAGSTVIHLGCDEPAPKPWSLLQEAHHFHPLQDLFRLQQKHTEARERQVQLAEEACLALTRARAGADAEALALLG